MKTKWTAQRYDEFLDAFAGEIGLPRHEAGEQWGAFSRQLSDADRRGVEAGGYAAGEEQGQEFNRLYPDTGEEG